MLAVANKERFHGRTIAATVQEYRRLLQRAQFPTVKSRIALLGPTVLDIPKHLPEATGKMGFKPNPEKQDFIRLRLAQNSRPGGRSKAEARKYYGGVYHRLDAEVRRAEVEGWRALQPPVQAGDGGDGGRRSRKAVVKAAADDGESRADVKGMESKGVGAGMRTRSQDAGQPASSKPQSESVVVGLLDAVEQEAGSVALGQDDGSVQPASGPTGTAVEDQGAGSSDLEEEESAQVNEHEQSGTSPAPTVEDEMAASNGLELDQKRAQTEKEGERKFSQPTSKAISQESQDQDPEPTLSGQTDAKDDEQVPAKEIPAVGGQSTMDEEGTGSPVSLERAGDRAEIAEDGEQDETQPDSPDSLDSTNVPSPTPFTPQSDDEDSVSIDLESLFGSDPDDLDAEDNGVDPANSGEGPQNGSQPENEIAREGNDEQSAPQPPSPSPSPNTHGSDVEELPSNADGLPRGQDEAEYSADEGNDSNADDLEDQVRSALADDVDDDSGTNEHGIDAPREYSADEADDSDVDDSKDQVQPGFPGIDDNDSDADEQQNEQGQSDFDPEGAEGQSNEWTGVFSGSGDDSFLPDSMLPDTSTTDQTEPPAQSSDAIESGEGDRKRKLSDGLSDLSPEVRAAFLDSSDSRAQNHYTGVINPDGPRHKRPRLRRPGQPRVPEQEQEQKQQEEDPKQSSTAEQSESNAPQAAAAKPSFLSSMIDEAKTKPLWPDGAH